MMTRDVVTVFALLGVASISLIVGSQMGSCGNKSAVDSGVVEYTEAAATPAAPTTPAAAPTVEPSRGDFTLKLADGGAVTIHHGLDHACERGWMAFANEDLMVLQKHDAGPAAAEPVYAKLRDKLLECQTEEPKLWGPPLEQPAPPVQNTCWCAADEVRCGPKLPKPDAGNFQACQVKGQ